MFIKTSLFFLILANAIACGNTRPNPDEYMQSQASAARSRQTSKAKSKSSKTVQSQKDSGNSKTNSESEDETTSETKDMAESTMGIRTLATSTEIATAKSTYQTACAACHGALENSSKKGATVLRINNSGRSGAIAAHANTINSGQWPKDTNDTTDDGTDTAILAATAMAEALK